MEEYVALGPRLPSTTTRWRTDAFARELTDWVSEQVGPVTSASVVKLRPWACVWRMASRGRHFFAKQNCAPQSHEPAVLALVAGFAPRRVVDVVATDPERGLLLSADRGPTLLERGVVDDAGWSRVVAEAAELQRVAAEYRKQLALAGLTTMRPQDAPAYLAMRCDQLAALPVADPRRLDPVVADRLLTAVPRVRDWAEQVAALDLPLTLQHNDLHAGNVVEVDGQLRFFDLADAVLAEPLAALLIPLRVLADQEGLGPDHPRLGRVADAALEVWTDRGTRAELRAALPAALRLAALARVEAWARCLLTMTDAELGEWGDSVPGWLEVVLDPPLLG